MANLDILNIDALANIYIVANTPSYLLRHFKNNQSVQQFADMHSAEELAEAIARVSSIAISDRTMDDIVVAYAAIVGLTFKNASKVEAVTATLDFHNIHWGRKILFLWEPYPTVEATMDTPRKLPVEPNMSMSVDIQPC